MDGVKNVRYLGVGPQSGVQCQAGEARKGIEGCCSHHKTTVDAKVIFQLASFFCMAILFIK
jgi:hypothetical protein